MAQGSHKDIPNKVILEAVVSLTERIADIEKNVATKEYVKVIVTDLEQELTKEIRAIGKAVDKDAVTMIDHEKRLGRVERHLAIK